MKHASGIIILSAFVLSFSSAVLAQNSNSAPYIGSGSGARAYKAWFEGCCGKFSMASGNPTCDPGSKHN